MTPCIGNRCASLTALAVVIFAMSALAGAFAPDVADFSGADTPSGWVVDGGEYRSPEYPSAVDRIEIAYTGAVESASATVYASNTVAESQIATFTAASSAASFDFPDTTEFRSFRISTANGLALSSFAAYVSPSALDAPGEVAVSNNTTGTSFDASWQPVAGAAGYRVYVWTNAVAGASAGTEVWTETFANSPAKTSSTEFDVSYTDSGASEWTFYKAYAHSEAGMVRIGNTSTKGVLVSPPLSALPDLPLTFRITSWRHATSDGQDMLLGIVSGGATNIFGHVRLGDDAATHHIAMPELNVGDRIAIFSPTNKSSARAIVDDVAILSGYSEGTESPSCIVNGQDVGLATSCRFEDLPSVPVFFAIEAYGRRGVTSAKTEAVMVDLSNPDKVVELNACPLSSLAGGSYAQDFDSLAAVTATKGDKEWLNGTTLHYWQAYTNGVAVNSIKWNGGTATTKGLYALRAGSDPSGSDRAFGACSVQGVETSFGIAFTNDTDRNMTLSSVAYLSQQWGFKNNKKQTLSVVARVADGLDWLSTYGDGWLDLCSTESSVYGEGDAHDTPVSTAVNVGPEIVVAPGRVLLLKWTISPPASGNAAMMGIDAVSVTFVKSQQQGFFLRLANNSRIRP